MSQPQVFSGYQSEIKGSFEYSGTWSEEHRHQCEVRSIAALPNDEITERIKKIGDKRGERAAAQMTKDVNAQRYLNSKDKSQAKPAPPKGANKTQSLFG